MLHATTFTRTWSLSQPWCSAPWYKGFQPIDWQQWYLENCRLWTSKFLWSCPGSATDKPSCDSLVPSSGASTWSDLLWDGCWFMEYRLHPCWIVCWQAYYARENWGISPFLFSRKKLSFRVIHQTECLRCLLFHIIICCDADYFAWAIIPEYNLELIMARCKFYSMLTSRWLLFWRLLNYTEVPNSLQHLETQLHLPSC